MKKIFWLNVFIVSALLITTVSAQAKSFCWEVSAGKAKIYLMGSVHIGSPDMYPLPSAVEKAFKSSDGLVVEVDIAEMDQAMVYEYLLKEGMYGADDSVKNHIPKKLYNKLNKALKKYNISLTTYEKMKPWVLYLVLSELTSSKNAYDAKLGVDLYFLKKAKDRKMLIVELETAVFQLDLLSGISPEVQLLLLDATAEGLSDNVDETDKLFKYWKAGDAKGMTDYIFSDLKKYPKLKPFYYALFDDRNIRMAKKIDKLLKKKHTYFVVVGAGHLVGKTGLVELMKKRGYKTRQL